MKVKDLIDYLKGFNPSADIEVITDNVSKELFEDGWSGDNDDILPISKDKASKVYITTDKDLNWCCNEA